MTKDEALKLAFDGLEALGKWYCLDEGPRTDEPWEGTVLRKVCVAADKAMTEPDHKAYKPDLEPEQEPVAWMYEWDGRMHLTFTDQQFVEEAHPHFNKSTPLYTAPPQRTWVGLTDEDIKAVNAQVSQIPPIDYTTTTYAKAIEAKLKEKNT